jgi:hypothetical protein
MEFGGLITKTVAWELTMFRRIGRDSIYNSIDLEVRYRGDHKGVRFMMVLMSYTIIEAAIYSTEHEGE